MDFKFDRVSWRNACQMMDKIGESVDFIKVTCQYVNSVNRQFQAFIDEVVSDVTNGCAKGSITVERIERFADIESNEVSNDHSVNGADVESNESPNASLVEDLSYPRPSELLDEEHGEEEEAVSTKSVLAHIDDEEHGEEEEAVSTKSVLAHIDDEEHGEEEVVSTKSVLAHIDELPFSIPSHAALPHDSVVVDEPIDGNTSQNYNSFQTNFLLPEECDSPPKMGDNSDSFTRQESTNNSDVLDLDMAIMTEFEHINFCDVIEDDEEKELAMICDRVSNKKLNKEKINNAILQSKDKRKPYNVFCDSDIKIQDTQEIFSKCHEMSSNHGIVVESEWELL